MTANQLSISPARVPTKSAGFMKESDAFRRNYGGLSCGTIVATDLYRPWAAKERDRLTKLMTSAQIAEAQRLAGEWRPKAE